MSVVDSSGPTATSAAASAPSAVRVRFFAAARAAAGTPETTVEVPPAATVADVLAAAVRQCGPDLSTVLARCSFLLDQVAVHGRDTRIDSATTLDVLPPFAGG